MKRCVEICPALTAGGGIEKLDIIRHGVGLRPFRREGVRIETEQIDDVSVVHNYGHGGFGYQQSWATAAEAAKLVQDIVDGGRTRPRL
jgi:D-amino-acid oxidase